MVVGVSEARVTSPVGLGAGLELTRHARGAHGFYIDISEAEKAAAERRMDEAVAEIAENRSVIEQAKGMIMLVYGVNADIAFDLLRWRSQETNVKVRRLAEQLTDEFVSLGKTAGLQPRDVYDATLLTLQRRAQRDQ